MKVKSIYCKFKVYLMMIFLLLFIICSILLLCYDEVYLGLLLLIIALLDLVLYIVTDSKVILRDEYIIVRRKFKIKRIYYNDILNIEITVNETTALQQWINIKITLNDFNEIKVNFFLFIVENSCDIIEKICQSKKINFSKKYKKLGEDKKY